MFLRTLNNFANNVEDLNLRAMANKGFGNGKATNKQRFNQQQKDTSDTAV